MKHRTLRGVAALTLGAALVLSGCSSEGGGSDDETSASPSASDGATSSPEDVAALEAVTVTGDPGSEPTVEFEAPLEVSGPVALSLGDGDGDEIAKGQEVTLHQAAYSGTDASKLGSTWEDDSAQQIVLDDQVYPSCSRRWSARRSARASCSPHRGRTAAPSSPSPRSPRSGTPRSLRTPPTCRTAPRARP